MQTTKKKPRQKSQDKKQSQRFVETARKLEVDESGKTFERALKSVTAKAKPRPKRSLG